MSELNDIENRMIALKAEIKAITQIVRSLRQQEALNAVKQAEQRLIKSQLDARSLSLPVAVLGAGKCKNKELPYSMVKAHRDPSDSKL
jgi:hypothetical protein